jgi:hypothetical protein
MSPRAIVDVVVDMVRRRDGERLGDEMMRMMALALGGAALGKKLGNGS